MTDGTFNDLQKIIDDAPENSTIELDKDYFNDEELFNYTSEIKISKPLTINGNNHVLDARNKSRILKISADNVILNDIVFINGYSVFEGGAVYQSTFYRDHVEINNCKFENNVASCGGAVLLNNGTINNCEFTDNVGYWGGAVDISYGSVSNSKFQSNYAYFGGAVHLNRHSEIINSTFIKNAASCSGGAVYQLVNSRIVNSTFIENKANVLGGSVFSHNSSIINSTFKYNMGDKLYKKDFNKLLPESWFTNNVTRWELPITNLADALFAENSYISNNVFINYESNKNAETSAIKGENNTIKNCTYLNVNTNTINQENNTYQDIDSNQIQLKKPQTDTTGNPIALLLICLLAPILLFKKYEK